MGYNVYWNAILTEVPSSLVCHAYWHDMWVYTSTHLTGSVDFSYTRNSGRLHDKAFSISSLVSEGVMKYKLSGFVWV